MDKLIPISDAASVLGVSITTLRRWEIEGKLVPERTASDHRRYRLSKIKPELLHVDPTARKTEEMAIKWYQAHTLYIFWIAF